VGLIKRAFARRLSGDRPSPVSSAVTSVVVGVAVAVITYKTLRS
jgi:hypothetical protein